MPSSLANKHFVQVLVPLLVFALAETTIADSRLSSLSADKKHLVVGVRPQLELLESAEHAALERLRKRTGYVECQAVFLEDSVIREWIVGIEANRIPPEQSRLTIRFSDSEEHEFTGVEYEVVQGHEVPGPFYWAGQIDGDAESHATIIISRGNRLWVRLTTSEKMFRLERSHWSDNHILCELDPERIPNRKID